MLRALPNCSHFMTTVKPYAGNLRGERLDHCRDVILRLRWGSAQNLDGWVLKNIFLVNRWHSKFEYMWKLLLYINSIRCMPCKS